MDLSKQSELDQLAEAVKQAGHALNQARDRHRKLAAGEKNYLSALMMQIRNAHSSEKLSMAELEMRARATQEWSQYVDGVCAARFEVDRLELEMNHAQQLWKGKQSDQSLQRTIIQAGIYHRGG